MKNNLLPKPSSKTKQSNDSKLIGRIRSNKDILDTILNEIQPLNVREFLHLPDDLVPMQKHWVVAVVSNLLNIAYEKKWNLALRNDSLYVYNGTHWQKLDKKDMKFFLGKAANKMGFPLYDVTHFEFKDKLLKQLLSDAYLPLPQHQPEKVLLNLQNGTMEFSSGGWKLRESNPQDFLTYQLPFEYNGDAKCPLYDKFLNEVLPDVSSQMVLQEFIGYIFTDLKLEKLLMLVGQGANGKSVFFEVISALVGRQNILTYSMSTFRHEYNRAKLSDVLLNYSSEKGTDLDPDTFKALISGEPIQAREPYGSSFTMFNRVRFIINSNELPKETEHNNAYFRRFLIIPFDVTIEQDKMDIDLANKIISYELSGVFNWILKGVERIIDQRKFTHCVRSTEVLEDFKKQHDSVALFIENYQYEASKIIKSPISDIYEKYKRFCVDDGYRPIGKNKFSARLEKQGFEKCRMNNGGIAFMMAETIYN